MFNVDELRRQVEALIRDYPELEEDEVLRADMLDAETDLKGALALLVKTTSNNKLMIEAISHRLAELTARKARFARRGHRARCAS